MLSSLRACSSGGSLVENVSELRHDIYSSSVALEAMVCRHSGFVGRGSVAPPSLEGSSQTTLFQEVPSEPSRISFTCLEIIQQSARFHGFSQGVSRHLDFCRRPSTGMNYQSNG